MNRLTEYDPPDEYELVDRLVGAVHKQIDDAFPSAPGTPNTRFARTDFSAPSEDTVVEFAPATPSRSNQKAADGKEGNASSRDGKFLPAPPSSKPKKSVAKQGAPSASNPTTAPKQKTTPSPDPATVPSGLTFPPRGRGESTKSDFKTIPSPTNISSLSRVETPSVKAVSVRLFAFLFAILVGIVLGGTVFLFWGQLSMFFAE